MSTSVPSQDTWCHRHEARHISTVFRNSDEVNPESLKLRNKIAPCQTPTESSACRTPTRPSPCKCTPGRSLTRGCSIPGSSPSCVLAHCGCTRFRAHGSGVGLSSRDVSPNPASSGPTDISTANVPSPCCGTDATTHAILPIHGSLQRSALPTATSLCPARTDLPADPVLPSIWPRCTSLAVHVSSI